MLGPSAFVTITWTVPGVPAGAVAVIAVSLVGGTKLAGLPAPNSTALAPVNPVPLIVTVVPPAVGPCVGLSPVTVGTSASAGVAKINPRDATAKTGMASRSLIAQECRLLSEGSGRRSPPGSGP